MSEDEMKRVVEMTVQNCMPATNGNGKKYNTWFELFKIIFIPALTGIIFYFGAFTEMRKDVQYLVKSFDKLEASVEKHHADREIHIPHKP